MKHRFPPRRGGRVKIHTHVFRFQAVLFIIQSAAFKKSSFRALPFKIKIKRTKPSMERDPQLKGRPSVSPACCAPTCQPSFAPGNMSSLLPSSRRSTGEAPPVHVNNDRQRPLSTAPWFQCCALWCSAIPGCYETCAGATKSHNVRGNVPAPGLPATRNYLRTN